VTSHCYFLHEQFIT